MKTQEKKKQPVTAPLFARRTRELAALCITRVPFHCCEIMKPERRRNPIANCVSALPHPINGIRDQQAGARKHEPKILQQIRFDVDGKRIRDDVVSLRSH